MKMQLAVVRGEGHWLVVKILLLLFISRCYGYGSGGWSLRDYPEYYYGYDYEEYAEEQEICTFDETAGYAIYGQNDVTMPDATIESCKKECLDAEYFECSSFDYNTRTKSCFLTSSTKNSPYYGRHENAIHFEKTCRTVYGDEAMEHKARPTPSTNTVAGKVVNKDGHCYRQHGPVGESSQDDYFPEGSRNDHVVSLSGNISRVIIAYGSIVESVQFYYGEIPGNQYFDRREHVTIFETTLSPGEYIESISGQVINYFSLFRIQTNRRMLGPFGSNDNGSGDFEITGSGKALAYISGNHKDGYPSTPGSLIFYFFC